MVAVAAPAHVEPVAASLSKANSSAEIALPAPVAAPAAPAIDPAMLAELWDAVKAATAMATAATAAVAAADEAKANSAAQAQELTKLRKLVNVLTEDLDEERKIRAKIEVELDRIKKKMILLEGH